MSRAAVWAAGVVAGLVLAFAGSSARAATPGEVAALLGEDTCPAYRVKQSFHHSAAELRDALAGEFRVWQSRLRLVPPVDWEDDSLDPSTRATLHQWVWSDVLLRAANAGDREAYDHALALARDWIAAEPPPGRSAYPWEGKDAADRAPYLAFIARLGACRGWLGAADAVKLIDALRAHGERLASDAHYSADTNHGLWSDVGLITLADQVAPFLGSAASWRAHAVVRFHAHLAAEVDEREGMFLEHSVAYEFNLLSLLGQMQPQLGDPSLDPVIARLADTAGWLLEPDGTFAPLGDTSRASGLRYDVPLDHRGLAFFPRSGWAVVREPSSYLITSATYFSVTHKHADELSFELYDHGRRLVDDTGKFRYDETDPYRIYAESAEAHNGVIVNDHGGRWWQGRRAYGSGMVAAGSGGGWDAILARNRLAPRGVRQQRLLLYRPGSALVVLDRATARRRHRFTRLFHLDPGLRLTGRRGRTIVGPGFHGSLRDWSAGRRRVITGATDPVQGWASPAEGLITPSTTVTFTTRHATGTDVTAFALDRHRLWLDRLHAPKDAFLLDVRQGRAPITRLAIRRSGRALRVSASPAPGGRPTTPVSPPECIRTTNQSTDMTGLCPRFTSLARPHDASRSSSPRSPLSSSFPSPPKPRAAAGSVTTTSPPRTTRPAAWPATWGGTCTSTGT